MLKDRPSYCTAYSLAYIYTVKQQRNAMTTLATLSFSDLLLNLRDCREAAEAARSMGDLAGENKYMDQMAPYLMEMESRKVINKTHKEA